MGTIPNNVVTTIVCKISVILFGAFVWNPPPCGDIGCVNTANDADDPDTVENPSPTFAILN